MTAKGLATLAHLVTNLPKATIAAVVVGKDAAVQNDYAQEIADLAQAHNIPVFPRQDSQGLLAALANNGDTYFRMAISWRWLLPTADALGPLVVLHDSPLPRYRGFAPLVNMLINGEPEIGVTSLFAGEDYDVGPIIAQAVTPITYPITIASAILTLEPLYAQVALQTVEKLLEHPDYPGSPQVEAQATYSLWRDEADYRLDWTLDAHTLARTVDALGYPYNGAQCLCNDSPAIVLAATPLPDVTIENRTPGKVLFVKAGLPIVVCGKGLLRIDQLVATDTVQSLLPLQKFRSRFS